MKIHSTATDTPNGHTESLWVYNGLDCMLTLEIFQAIEPQLDNTTRTTYEFRKDLQAPVLEMNMRGIRVDTARRDAVIADYNARLARLSAQLTRILAEGVGYPINWNSPAQLSILLYDVMRLPPVKKRNANGTYTPTVNREALEKLSAYFVAKPIITHILAIRDINKKLGVLRTEIDPDNRMRTSYNIAGTTTGRFSSSLSEFGTGTNLQNIEDRLRSVFVADPGMKLAYIDLEQAESRACGAIHWNLFNDPTYLDACESGDLHTSVCKLAWPNLGWFGSLKADREVAEQPFYRQHSYRHMAKVLGHGSNYGGKPVTMASHTKIETSVVRAFQTEYFRAFPSFLKWHEWVAEEIRRTGRLTSLLGMRRDFHGRPDDASTVREAIAFDPQSTVGELLNRGLLALWRLNICQILLQIHDAVVIQFPEHRESTVVPAAVQALRVPIDLARGRVMVIPSEAKVGWNWGSASPTNPDGLTKWTGADARRRSETTRLD